MDEKVRKIFGIAADEKIVPTEHTPLSLFPSKYWDQNLKFDMKLPNKKIIIGSAVSVAAISSILHPDNGMRILILLSAVASTAGLIFTMRLAEKQMKTSDLQMIYSTGQELVVVNTFAGKKDIETSTHRFNPYFAKLNTKYDQTTAKCVGLELIGSGHHISIGQHLDSEELPHIKVKLENTLAEFKAAPIPPAHP